MSLILLKMLLRMYPPPTYFTEENIEVGTQKSWNFPKLVQLGFGETEPNFHLQSYVFLLTLHVNIKW